MGAENYTGDMQESHPELRLLPQNAAICSGFWRKQPCSKVKSRAVAELHRNTLTADSELSQNVLVPLLPLKNIYGLGTHARTLGEIEW